MDQQLLWQLEFPELVQEVHPLLDLLDDGSVCVGLSL